MNWLIEALKRARNSTVKRVKDLTEVQLDWHSADKISIRDIAWHIAECDLAAIKPLKPDLEFDDRLYPDLAERKSKEVVLEYLEDQLKLKCDIIAANLNRLNEKTAHESYGSITIGEHIIAHGIDHEAHHRGQITLIRKENHV
ncbi:MAG: DinB family protein [Calditrichaceae bacterium]|jgi:uncharacterized damage-inducible protein DinB